MSKNSNLSTTKEWRSEYVNTQAYENRLSAPPTEQNENGIEKTEIDIAQEALEEASNITPEEWEKIEADIGEFEEDIRSYMPKQFLNKTKAARHYTIMYRTLTELKTVFNLTSTVLNLEGYRIQNKIMLACMYESATRPKKADNGYGSLLTTNPTLSSHFGVTLMSVHKFLKRLEADGIIKIAKYISVNEEETKKINRLRYTSPLDYGCKNPHETPKEIIFLKNLSYNKPEKKRYIKGRIIVQNKTAGFYFKMNYDSLKKWKKAMKMQPVVLYFFLCTKIENDKRAIVDGDSRTSQITLSWVASKLGVERRHLTAYLNVLKRHGLVEIKKAGTITVYPPKYFKE